MQHTASEGPAAVSATTSTVNTLVLLTLIGSSTLTGIKGTTRPSTLTSICGPRTNEAMGALPLCARLMLTVYCSVAAQLSLLGASQEMFSVIIWAELILKTASCSAAGRAGTCPQTAVELLWHDQESTWEALKIFG